MDQPFRYRIVVEWSEDDARYIARVPALPGCVAHGKTEAAAAREVRKAAEAMLDVLRKDGDEPPPVDSTADYSGQTRIRIPRGLHAELAREASAEGVSLNMVMVRRLSGGRDATPHENSAGESETRERPARRSTRKAG